MKNKTKSLIERANQLSDSDKELSGWNNMIYKPKCDPKDIHRGYGIGSYYGIKPNTTHDLLAKFIVDTTEGYVTGKGADYIAIAIMELHHCFCYLDRWRTEEFIKDNPELLKLASIYTKVYGCPNRSLEDLESKIKEEA